MRRAGPRGALVDLTLDIHAARSLPPPGLERVVGNGATFEGAWMPHGLDNNPKRGLNQCVSTKS
jgi:hypothetical protein